VGVRKPKPKKKAAHSCYLCGADAEDNLVGVIHDRFCDYEKAAETGEEHWFERDICSQCFVKTHGAVFVIRAMKKT
jgi:hypothetical protein